MNLFRTARWSRRDLLKQSGILSAVAAVAPISASAAAVASAAPGCGDSGTATENLFTKIGVRPIVNARGTFTIISGSQSLPEVKQAMYEASKYYVQMDEMMAAVGAEPQLRVWRKSSGLTRRRSSISYCGSHRRSSTRAQKRLW